MPALMRSYDVWRVTSLFSNTICPLSGRRRPLTRLTRLVLPAPLEPISASTSPCLTLKSTESTARLSPNDLVSDCVVSRFISARLFHPGRESLDRTHDAGRQRQHEHDQHRPEQELP